MINNASPFLLLFLSHQPLFGAEPHGAAQPETASPGWTKLIATR
jgi:hypothetical protein